jgi:hypothetical protein
MKKFLFAFLGLALVAFGFAAFIEPHTAMGASLCSLPLFANMSRQELEQIAADALSDNFGGDDDDDDIDLFGMSNFDGSDDLMINFMGSARSFNNEHKSGVYIQFRIVNDSGAEKVICLNPAYYNRLGLTITKPNTSVTDVSVHYHDVTEMAVANPEIHAVLDDGIIYTAEGKSITVTGVNAKIRDHFAFTKTNPVRIPKMTLSAVVTATGAVDTTIYQKILTIRKVNPYLRAGQDITIDLNEFFNVMQNQPGKIEIDTARYNLQADDQTLLFMAVPNGITATIRFDIGGNANLPKMLNKAAEIAKQNQAAGTVSSVPVEVKRARKQRAAKQLNLLRKMAFKRK